jgi:hypothetical protein
MKLSGVWVEGCVKKIMWVGERILISITVVFSPANVCTMLTLTLVDGALFLF